MGLINAPISTHSGSASATNTGSLVIQTLRINNIEAAMANEEVHTLQ